MILPSFRSRWPLILFIITVFAMTLYTVHRPLLATYTSYRPPAPEGALPVDEPPHVIHKPPKPPPPPPLPEYFPLAASAQSPADLPPVPSWNKPPSPHVPESTRLYIGFTRYWPLLQQVVVGYVTAGWPPEDIYVVENTGTFDANKNGLLTSQNPFYLDYHRLTKILGVNVITTPSLQTFAQLQNLYLSEAINNNLTHYFWAHMDTVPLSHEDAQPYKSLYSIAVDVIRESFSPTYEVHDRWAVRFFSYDWLALVNVKNYIRVGGWDSMISYYGTDCDMHGRFKLNGLETPIADAGEVFDVGRSLEDLEVLYRRRQKANTKRVPAAEDEKTIVKVGEHGKITIGEGSKNSSSTTAPPPPPTSNTETDTDTDTQQHQPTAPETLEYLSSTEEDTPASPAFSTLRATLDSLADAKRKDPYRNSWQLKQSGGHGEPFYYDADGWEKALQITIAAGVEVYELKWGHKGCDIQNVGLKEGDQWAVEKDNTWACEREGGKRKCRERGEEDTVCC